MHDHDALGLLHCIPITLCSPSPVGRLGCNAEHPPRRSQTLLTQPETCILEHMLAIARAMESASTEVAQRMLCIYNSHVQADLNEEPKLDKDGLLRTPGTIEFFRLVNDDVSQGLRCSSRYWLHA